MAKYALLFAGCMNRKSNYPRYGNDLGFMYEVLTTKYSYNEGNIKVLFANGDNINYKDRTITTEAGLHANFVNSLVKFSEIVKEDDTFILMISNHGGKYQYKSGNNIITSAIISAWEMGQIPGDQVKNLLNRIKANKIIIFGQCQGGNLLSERINRSIIVTANGPGKDSYGTLDEEYDEFLYQFISYYNRQYPDGNNLNHCSNDLSIQSAYLYAKENNRYKNPIPLYYGSGNSIILHEIPHIACYDLNPHTQYL